MRSIQRSPLDLPARHYKERIGRPPFNRLANFVLRMHFVWLQAEFVSRRAKISAYVSAWDSGDVEVAMTFNENVSKVASSRRPPGLLWPLLKILWSQCGWYTEPQHLLWWCSSCPSSELWATRLGYLHGPVGSPPSNPTTENVGTTVSSPTMHNYPVVREDYSGEFFDWRVLWWRYY